MTHTFKVGDRVRVTGNSSGHCHKIGDVVTLVEGPTPSGTFLGESKEFGWLTPSDMTPLVIGAPKDTLGAKPGDVVRCDWRPDDDWAEQFTVDKEYVLNDQCKVCGDDRCFWNGDGAAWSMVRRATETQPKGDAMELQNRLYEIFDQFISSTMGRDIFIDKIMFLIEAQSHKPTGSWGPWADTQPDPLCDWRSQRMPDGTTLYQVWSPAQVVTLYGWANGGAFYPEAKGATHTITGPIVPIGGAL